MSENHFEDLLSNQGFSSKADKKGPRTIAEMRRQDQARDVDPLKLKVCAGERPVTQGVQPVAGLALRLLGGLVGRSARRGLGACSGRRAGSAAGGGGGAPGSSGVLAALTHPVRAGPEPGEALLCTQASAGAPARRAHCGR